mgnify:CR=1 FL=1
MPLRLYSAALIALLALSAWRPYDLATWAMEVAPVVVVLPLLWATHQRFPLTPLLYALIFVHAAVLVLGGHYTYARVPLGFWMQEAFGLARNPYDGIGHFAQGFIAVARVHLVHFFICLAQVGGRAHRIAKWSVKTRRVFCTITHDTSVCKSSFFQSFSDGTDPAIHHITWSDNVNTSFCLC